MIREKRRRLPAEARELGERIEQWRRTRTKRGPMPSELWDVAVSLASRHGVYAIAQAVRLEYSALRRRVEALEDDAQTRGGSATAAFVELRPSTSSISAPTSEIVVEVSDVGGRRMTIRVGSGSALDVTQMVRALWGQGG